MRSLSWELLETRGCQPWLHSGITCEGFINPEAQGPPQTEAAAPNPAVFKAIKRIPELESESGVG